MKRPVKLEFRLPTSVTDITGNIPKWCKDSIPYAQAERIIVKEGTLINQFYSHFLFFIEIMDIDLHSDIVVDYLIEETSLFLFMMLDGKIDFHLPDMEMKMEVSGNTCYATYNLEGKFTFSLAKGKHRLCYIVPRTEWVTKNIQFYPRLERFIETMMTSEILYGHLPSCKINKGMELGLQKLFNRYEKKNKDLEAVLLRDAKRIMYHYQTLLDDKLTQRPLLIKEYIEKNYTNPELNNRVLMREFHMIEKTLITMFKAKFGITPYNYIIELRMEKARLLLENKEKTPTEVSLLIGYDNFRSFSARFKETFGLSPSTYSNYAPNRSPDQSS